LPREFQLKASVTTINKKDCIVNVGTGYRKTVLDPATSPVSDLEETHNLVCCTSLHSKLPEYAPPSLSIHIPPYHPHRFLKHVDFKLSYQWYGKYESIKMVVGGELNLGLEASGKEAKCVVGMPWDNPEAEVGVEGTGWRAPM
jgi:hypothetical protein